MIEYDNAKDRVKATLPQQELWKASLSARAAKRMKQGRLGSMQFLKPTELSKEMRESLTTKPILTEAEREE